MFKGLKDSPKWLGERAFTKACHEEFIVYEIRRFIFFIPYTELWHVINIFLMDDKDQFSHTVHNNVAKALLTQ